MATTNSAKGADEKDKKIPEVPHLENVTGVEKIPVSAVGGVPRYIEVNQIVDKANTENTPDWDAAEGEVGYIKNKPLIDYEEVSYKTIADIKNMGFASPGESAGFWFYSIREPLFETLDEFPSTDCILRINGEETILHRVEGTYKLADAGDGTMTDTSGSHYSETTICLTVAPIGDRGSAPFGIGISVYPQSKYHTSEYSSNVHLEFLIPSLKSVKKLDPELLIITQETGDSEIAVMSQKATTKAFTQVNENTNKLKELEDNLQEGLDKIPTLQSGAKGGEKNYIYSDPTIQGKGAIAAARYRANDKGRLTAQYKYWGDTDFNYNTEFPQATPTADGVMSAEDKKAIDKAVSDIGNIATDVADLEFTVETLNEGLGHANNDIRELGDRIDSEFEDVIFGKEVVDETTMPELKTHTIDEVKKALFVDMWNHQCTNSNTTFGKYNEETGYFELNGLTDITYEQAIEIYSCGVLLGHINSSSGLNYRNCKNIRTVLPQKWYGEATYTPTFMDCINIEVIPGQYGIVKAYSFYNCVKLRVIGSSYNQYTQLYNLNNAEQKMESSSFYNCESLEMVYGTIRGNYNIDVRWSPLLTLENFQWWINNAVNTAPISIIVHPDVYAKLTDESNTEWYQVNQDAIAKQITFATA